MCIDWRLLLDFVVIGSMIGASAFLKLVKQKEVYYYMNLSLLLILFLVYAFYFIAMERAVNLRIWLERKLYGGRLFVRHYSKRCRYPRISYRMWMSSIFLIVLAFILYTVFMFVLAHRYRSSKGAFSLILGILSAMYPPMHIAPKSELQMRFRVKYHGSSLLIFVGLSLLICDSALVVLGLFLILIGILTHRKLHKDLSETMNVIERRRTVTYNGRPAGRMSLRMLFFENIRRRLWRGMI